MYKALIVDDEKIIRIALKSMINWEEQGFTVCGTAANCTAAFELIKEHSPHLLIVDIMMPETDGITFIKHLRSIGFDGQIIILSNHQKFTYAVEALHNHVFDYILKTDISAELLISVLKKVKEYLDEHVKETPVEEISSPDNELAIFTNMIQGRPVSNTTFTKTYLFLDVFLRTRITKNNFEINIPKDTLKNIVQEVIGSAKYSIIPVSNDSILIFVPQEEHVHFLATLPELVQKIGNLIRLYMNTDCGFFCSNPFHTADEFSDKFHNLSDYEKFVIYHGFRCIINESSIKPHSRLSFDTAALVSQLKCALDSNEYEKCKELIKEAIMEFCTNNLPITSMLHMLSNINSFMIFDNSSYLESSKEELHAIAVNYKKCCTINEYMNSLNELVDLISLNKLTLNTSSLREEIKMVDEFIQDNLDKKITLAMLAKYVNRSENYLSRLFKAETDINIIQYINNKKMQRAKELLANLQLSIKEVSLSLGFDEPSYFNRIFNKTYGMNPSDYRKILSSSFGNHDTP